jgi:hypothetical protein
VHEPGSRAFVGTDTIEWLLASDEPATRWVTLTQILGRAAEDAQVTAAHQAVLADAGTHELAARLGDWDDPRPLSGHDSAAYAPNLLGLLADMGVTYGEIPAVDATIEAMLRHQDEAGRLATPSVNRRISPDPVFSALLCDSHAISESLVRFGKADHPAVRQALERMASDLTPTSAGIGWTCVPSNGFRGPGRKGDVCPMVTLEAVRTLARLPVERRPLDPPALLDAARTALAVWSNRAGAKPYMFGHGLAFKTIKWPPFWYDVLWALDAVGRYPELWTGSSARPEDRRAIVELTACLIAYNLDAGGRATPRSCYRGFEDFSFGQKKRPSPFATARVLAVLKPLEDLAEEAIALDVLALGSSKGGSGTALAPRG